MVKFALPPEGTERDGDALPELTITPDTAIVAPKWVAVGVSTTLVTALGTPHVYEIVPELNEGTRPPALTPRPDKLASDDGARLTCTVYTSWFPA